jgi:hypothetical protein
MRSVTWLVLATSACGRVSFDPIDVHGDADVSRPGDGSVTGDGVSVDGPMSDAQPFACANAVPVQVGTPITISTCRAGDHVEGCGPTGTEEVVFELVVPATAGYTFRAFDTGTQDISNSTGVLDATCMQVSGCAGILGLSFNAGDVVDLVVEASSGGCATIDFSVTSP